MRRLHILILALIVLLATGAGLAILLGLRVEVRFDPPPYATTANNAAWTGSRSAWQGLVAKTSLGVWAVVALGLLVGLYVFMGRRRR